MKNIVKRLSSIVLVLIMLFGNFSIFKGTFITEGNAASGFNQKEISLPGSADTDYYWRTYYASTSEVVSFMDYKGMYNVACYDAPDLYIYRYDAKLNLSSTVKITYDNALFGNVICDNNGNYYICWGKNDVDATNSTVLIFSKYNYSGTLVSTVSFKGYELAPHNPADYWGTKYPFDAGNCTMAINNGVLACNYAREMYSGHQSNHVVYIDCNTMTRVDGRVPYCSHSFDQDCLAVSDGGFLMANHGDAYPRSFVVSKIDASRNSNYEIDTFHFREGSNRAYGYNETYAQLGGLAETQNTYVFCASSERTLSYDVAPVKASYCSYSEARDLFIQILKKDFYNYSYSGSDPYYVNGTARKATGTRPESAETQFYLTDNVQDNGVIWLTDYSDEYFATNPKIVSISQDSFLVMWEKRAYADYSLVNTYYMILKENGTVSKNATEIGKVSLPANTDVVYRYGKVYWTTKGAKAYINTLEVESHSYRCTIIKKPTCTQVGEGKYECSCGDSYIAVIPATGHKASSWIVDKKATCTTEGSRHKECVNCGNGMGREVIPKTGHTSSDWKTSKKATCTASGIKYKECTVCRVWLDKKTIPATGHKASNWIIDKKVTCTTDGSRHKECVYCGNGMGREVIAKTGHKSSDWKTSKKATCTASGIKYKECTVCRVWLDKKTIPATGHKASNWIIDKKVTCTTNGSRHKECVNCGNGMGKETIYATGHKSSDWKVSKKATCTTDGVKYKECTTCRVWLDKKTIPATGHKASNWIIDKKVTCTTDGSRHKECVNCGNGMGREVIPKTGHTSSDWKVSKKATCTTSGIKYKECTVCRVWLDKKTIPATGHKASSWIIDKKATCTTDGSRHKECVYCGNGMGRETILKTGHTSSDWKVSKKATCTTDGVKYKECTTCRVWLDKKTIAKTGHKSSDWKVYKKATATQDGLKYKECTVCREWLDKKAIPKTGK